MEKIKRILVPTDFSPTADRALEWAKTLALATNASIHLLYVDDDPLLNAPTTGQEYRDEYEDKMAVKFDGILPKHLREKFDVQYAVKSGIAAEQIFEYVANHDIDLIVIGTKGRSAVMDALLGSVAHAVIKDAKVPVVSVRHAH